MPYDFDQIHERRTTNSIKWTTYPDDVLPLWVADMDFQAPDGIRSALHAAVDHGVLGYERLTHRTRRVVAARMERLYGWQVDPDWVVDTIGVVNGFNIAARAFCEGSDGVLIHEPAYVGFYSIYANLGLTKQVIPFEYTTYNGALSPHLDRASCSAAFHTQNARTRIFLLCHPHNPLGKVFSREELRMMADVALENDAIIVSDEIHSEIRLGEQPHIPLASLSPEIADKTITLVSPSKTFNVPGLFCGFAIISNSTLRERYKRTIEQLTGHVSSLGLIAAEAAFSGDCDAWLFELLQYLRGTRDLVTDTLKTSFPEARYTVPDATYLQWIDFSAYSSSGAIPTSPHTHFLQKSKVALSDGKTFGSEFESCVRLNFGAPRSVVIEALARMKHAICDSSSD